MRACYDAQSAENHHPGHQWSALLPGLARRQGKVAAYRRSRLCLKARGPPRLHSPVLGRPRGVNSDTRRPLGTRRDACGCRRDICVCLIKTGFDRSVRRGLGLDSVSNSRDATTVVLRPLRDSLQSLRLRRGETATHSELSCPRQRALFALHARAATTAASTVRATRARVDHGQERKGE